VQRRIHFDWLVSFSDVSSGYSSPVAAAVLLCTHIDCIHSDSGSTHLSPLSAINTTTWQSAAVATHCSTSRRNSRSNDRIGRHRAVNLYIPPCRCRRSHLPLPSMRSAVSVSTALDSAAARAAISLSTQLSSIDTKRIWRKLSQLTMIDGGQTGVRVIRLALYLPTWGSVILVISSGDRPFILLAPEMKTQFEAN